MFLSCPPSPMLQKEEGEKRKKSYHYGFGHFVFYYILIICTTSIKFNVNNLYLFLDLFIRDKAILCVRTLKELKLSRFLLHTSALPVSQAAARSMCLFAMAAQQAGKSTHANLKESTEFFLKIKYRTHFCSHYLVLKHQSIDKG